MEYGITAKSFLQYEEPRTLHLHFLNNRNAIEIKCDLASVYAVPYLNLVLSEDCRLLALSCNSCLPVLRLADIIEHFCIEGPLIGFL